MSRRRCFELEVSGRNSPRLKYDGQSATDSVAGQVRRGSLRYSLILLVAGSTYSLLCSALIEEEQDDKFCAMSIAEKQRPGGPLLQSLAPKAPDRDWCS